MVSHSEKRIVWSPLSQNKFIVGGSSQLVLYDWSPGDSSIHHVASQQDLQSMRCFAWSPDPVIDNFVAVGFNNGLVDLLRLESIRHIREHTPSRSSLAPLSSKAPRACVSLAFCGVTPQYLAMGLEKLRNDPSLLIWDVHASTPTRVLSPIGSPPTHIIAPPPSPARPPLTGLPSTPRSHHLIPRTELGPRVDSRVLQTHSQNESVHSLTWLQQSNHLLAAGLSQRLLRLFDLRSSAPAVAHAPGRVYALSTDPFEPHHLASAGEGVVTVWDVRKLPASLLTFSERDALADGIRIQNGAVRRMLDLEFSSVRRGVLATLGQDASYVRLWDVIKTESFDVPPALRASDVTRTPKMSWTNATSMLPWGVSGGTHNVTNDTAQLSPNTSGSLVLSNTRKYDLETANTHDTPIHVQWSPRGSMAVAVGSAYRIFSSVQPGEIVPEPWSIVPAVVSEGVDDTGFGNFPIDVSRGRSPRSSWQQPTFGRGDEDGFPALTSARPSPKPRQKRVLKCGASFFPGPTSLAPPSPATGSVHIIGTTKLTENNVASSRTQNASGRPWRRAIDRTQALVDEDISMSMRRRVIKGYGLSHPAHNVAILKEVKEEQKGKALVEMWSCSPTAGRACSSSNGYNFANQGIRGIWEGFPSSIPDAALSSSPPPPGPLLDPLVVEGVHSISRSQSHRGRHRAEVPSQFTAALLLLSAHNQADAAVLESADWKPTISTAKLIQRRFALQLCGWSLRSEDISAVINKWEKDGRQSQAACWLVFLGRHGKAIDVLMRSKDSSHNIMAGTLAALTPASEKTPELRHQYERLVMRLEDPYFRATLTYLAFGDWGDVLEEEHIPLRERLAIALQFLEDDALSAYLRRIAEASVIRGDVEGIIVTGLTTSGVHLLQNYLDRTGDVQTAAILGAYIHPHQLKDVRIDRWLDAYRDLLDGWKFFHHRCQLDIDRGQMLQDFTQAADREPIQLAPPQILIRCNYCNKHAGSLMFSKMKATACPFCNRPLPRCSVCLMTLGIIPDSARNGELAHHDAPMRDSVDDAIVFCQTCRHGGHAAHILEWFYGAAGAKSRGTCAVADCDHRCTDEF
ncbi:hypothetical protein B0F90DRAFT_1808734 [Multifurca ochricompacta]|uniref:Uncharacterized protein n=1 Tax=Multifurca ochricompacta TaxID=376703 RepID=A0AAD4M7X6_9AGAM|nr:hypothetical protein B0F90DRAFT_1808734 [Multifurca ochricompacta]